MTESESIDSLRDRLASREAELNKVRARLKAAKDAALRPAVKSTISDIQKRYLSAVADLETKRTEPAQPVIRASNNGVSNLAKRFNKGIDGKKIERASITVRGDIKGARSNFLAADGAGAVKKKKGEWVDQPTELLVEDDDGLPSWAKNQQKLMIRKENARSSIRDVDVGEIKDSMLEKATTNHLDATAAKPVVSRGSVKAALAMWGKTADEDARVLALKKEEEERKLKELARLQKEREEEERRQAVRKATEKFAAMALIDLVDEPDDAIELSAFLERKIVLIDKEIVVTEQELDKVELGTN